MDTVKTCSKCKRILPLDNFYKNKTLSSGYSSWCKDCCKEDSKRHHKCYKRDKEAARQSDRKARLKKLAFVQTFKTPCAKCGIDIPYVLNFHHINPATKSFDLGKAYTKKYEDIPKEVEKCVCLCYNCHHTYHYFYGMRPSSPEESLSDFLSENWAPPVENEII